MALNHGVEKLPRVGDVDLHHLSQAKHEKAIESLIVEWLVWLPRLLGERAELAKAASCLPVVAVEIREHRRLLEERFIPCEQIFDRGEAEFPRRDSGIGLDQPDRVLHALLVCFDEPGVGQDVDPVSQRVEFQPAAPHQVLEIAESSANDREFIEPVATEDLPANGNSFSDQ